MNEGSLFDPELAALAIKQAQGDLIEAIFLLRAYRTTLPRHGESVPLATNEMRVIRRISAVFKDVPGGQLLGPTYDYTHRLLDFSLAVEAFDRDRNDESSDADTSHHAFERNPANPDAMARVLTILENDGLVEAPPKESKPLQDITREPLEIPADRSTRLQALARGDEGYLLALAYSTQRGYGRNHAFAGEIRCGDVTLEFANGGPAPLEATYACAALDVPRRCCISQSDARQSRSEPLPAAHATARSPKSAMPPRADTTRLPPFLTAMTYTWQRRCCAYPAGTRAVHGRGRTLDMRVSAA